MKEFDRNTVSILAEESDFYLSNIEHLSCDLFSVGNFYEEFCRHERALGILWLLLEADTNAFCTELVVSARAVRHYLTRSARECYSDYHRAASRTEGFFNALAARDFPLARDIVALSPSEWMPNAEYEDDFCYARFMHLIVTQQGIPSEMVAILARFEKALDGGSAVRFNMCKALFECQQRMFNEAFDSLLLERKAEVAKLRSGIAQEDVRAAIETYVFVEGLGLLVVAERLGLVTKREYLFCPAIARIPGKPNVGGHVFALT